MSSDYGIRNSRGMAGRAIQNLDVVAGSPVHGHHVAQIVMSALLVLVIPYEKAKAETGSSLQQDAEKLAAAAFTSTTTRDTLRHVRNAIAHGRLTYTDAFQLGVGSVSRTPAEVTVTLEDGRAGEPPNWTATIQADRLVTLLRDLYKLLDSHS